MHYSTDYVFLAVVTGHGWKWMQQRRYVYGETKPARKKRYKNIAQSILFSVPAGYTL
ncbi:hypothetical protein ACNKHP_22425 [Shigella boydii]